MPCFAVETYEAHTPVRLKNMLSGPIPQELCSLKVQKSNAESVQPSLGIKRQKVLGFGLRAPYQVVPPELECEVHVYSGA